jgi:D-alanyl-lipoteichoic acid acyltransferase DltB (MBOAT superfamily)
VILLWISTAIDWFAAKRLDVEERRGRRLVLLWVSLGANLGLLGFFKYGGFLLENFQNVVGFYGGSFEAAKPNIILPVGISFYTFQTLTYALDIYFGRMKPTKSLLNFALFISFFSQLVAGPIERARNLLPQIEARRHPTRQQFCDGAWLMLWGLYKKMYIADNVARIADVAYTSPADHSFTQIVVATIAFAVQIYCDFSGYSDIARGTGKILGFEIMVNFNLPYFAKDPSDFWRRWHISLSELLRDYLYIPLGGSRGSKPRVAFNLMTTMTLGGLWHGANWHFVIWGIYHGLILTIYHMLRPPAERAKRAVSRLGNAGGIFVMFNLTLLGWMLFRVNSMSDAWVIARKAVTDWGAGHAAFSDLATVLQYSAVLIVMQFAQHNTGDHLVQQRLPGWARTLLYVLLYLSISVGGSYDNRPFIYFQF